MTTLVLYHHGSSACAAKVRFALAEKGLEWTSRYVDILRGEQFNPEYLKLNPKAVVPTLVHDGQTVVESTVICEYLDEVFPSRPIYPSAPLERAQVRVWRRSREIRVARRVEVHDGRRCADALREPARSARDGRVVAKRPPAARRALVRALVGVAV